MQYLFAYLYWIFMLSTSYTHKIVRFDFFDLANLFELREIVIRFLKTLNFS